MAITARRESRVLIASDDRELTAALARLLAQYRPEVAAVDAARGSATLTEPAVAGFVTSP